LGYFINILHYLDILFLAFGIYGNVAEGPSVVGLVLFFAHLVVAHKGTSETVCALIKRRLI
jgi:hypothetical protein